MLEMSCLTVTACAMGSDAAVTFGATHETLSRHSQGQGKLNCLLFSMSFELASRYLFHESIMRKSAHRQSDSCYVR